MEAEPRAPLENKNSETVNVWTVDREVPEGNKDSSGTSEGTICVIFGQESSFVLPVFLRSGLEFKCNKLICLVEEISRQENIQAVAQAAAEDVFVSVRERKPLHCTGTGIGAGGQTHTFGGSFLMVQIRFKKGSPN